MSESPKIRLQKIIADAGLASRREAEQLIADGLVRVNGHVAEIGDKADPTKDTVKVKNRVIPPSKPSLVTMALNKPRGYVCTNSDPHNPKTVFDLLPSKYRKTKLFCAGRLDKDSQGLLIITNDGALANKITHPSHRIIKRYQVTLSKPLDHKIIPVILKGVTIDGETLYATKIIPAKSGPKAEYSLEIHLAQGRKREIRRIFEHFGYFVDRLKRTHIGQLAVKGIPPGKIKLLENQDLDLLFKK